MKKTLLVTVMTLIIAASVVAGTLALYTTNVTENSGDVVAKEFKLVANAQSGFETPVKIAPTVSGEGVDKAISVANYDGNIISETDMIVTVKVRVTAADGKKMLPLTGTLVCGDLNKTTTTDTVTFQKTDNGELEATIEVRFSKDIQEIKLFTATLVWLDSENEGEDFAGSDYGVKLIFNVVGKQA